MSVQRLLDDILSLRNAIGSGPRRNSGPQKVLDALESKLKYLCELQDHIDALDGLIDGQDDDLGAMLQPIRQFLIHLRDKQ